MHVPITHELKTKVSARIRDVLLTREIRMNFGVDDISETYQLPKKHPAIIKLLWGEFDHLHGQLPKDWCNELRTDYSGNCQVNLECVGPDGETYTITVNLIGNKNHAILIPPNCSTYHHFSVAYDVCPEVKEFFDRQIEALKIEAKWEKVIEDVQKFLGSTKSLNAALKAWPEVRTFIPNEYLERIDKKAERSAAQTAAQNALAEIDREGAVAAATVAALAA